MTDYITSHNGTTRSMTDNEIAALDALRVEAAAQAAAVEAQTAARASALAKLSALGLTDAEVQALAG